MTISVERARGLLLGMEDDLRRAAWETGPADARGAESPEIVSQIAEAVEERRQHLQRQIRMALSRLDAGDFGYCATCGEDIDEERLVSAPLATVCAPYVAGRAR